MIPADRSDESPRSYDSRIDTWEHIHDVQNLLGSMAVALLARARDHDDTKLQAPEIEAFDAAPHGSQQSTYGSAEYEAATNGLGDALRHHYAAHRHHPEHFANGIADMNLLDVSEMLCDWVAAARRQDDGDPFASIEINQRRFGYGDEIKRLLVNTVKILV